MNKKNGKNVKGLIKELRSIRDKKNKELEGLSSEERIKYFRDLREKLASTQVRQQR